MPEGCYWRQDCWSELRLSCQPALWWRAKASSLLPAGCMQKSSKHALASKRLLHETFLLLVIIKAGWRAQAEPQQQSQMPVNAANAWVLP